MGAELRQRIIRDDQIPAPAPQGVRHGCSRLDANMVDLIAALQFAQQHSLIPFIVLYDQNPKRLHHVTLHSSFSPSPLPLWAGKDLYVLPPATVPATAAVC